MEEGGRGIACRVGSAGAILAPSPETTTHHSEVGRRGDGGSLRSWDDGCGGCGGGSLRLAPIRRYVHHL